jgi:hypothetical protein
VVSASSNRASPNHSFVGTGVERYEPAREVHSAVLPSSRTYPSALWPHIPVVPASQESSSGGSDFLSNLRVLALPTQQQSIELPRFHWVTRQAQASLQGSVTYPQGLSLRTNTESAPITLWELLRPHKEAQRRVVPGWNRSRTREAFMATQSLSVLRQLNDPTVVLTLGYGPVSRLSRHHLTVRLKELSDGKADPRKAETDSGSATIGQTPGLPNPSTPAVPRVNG